MISEKAWLREDTKGKKRPNAKDSYKAIVNALVAEAFPADSDWGKIGGKPMQRLWDDTMHNIIIRAQALKKGDK